MTASALISPCGTWRYQLVRTWDADADLVCWVMLNPSTADAEQDDPTIRRCVGFSRAWGFSGMVVVNLYALRATNPADLIGHPDPVGPDNAEHLVSAAQRCALVLCAWGGHRMATRRARITTVLLGCAAAPRMCLGVTKAGAPRHPLYARRDAIRIPFAGSPQPSENCSV